MNISKLKGYAFHALLIVIVFLSPSIQTAIAQHKAVAATVALVWGFVLHWAQGKLSQGD